jgi:hypothetical protein
MYHANRGDFEHFRSTGRVEVHAIQRGTAWQVETWIVQRAVVYPRTRDVAIEGLRRAAGG